MNLKFIISIALSIATHILVFLILNTLLSVVQTKTLLTNNSILTVDLLSKPAVNLNTLTSELKSDEKQFLKNKADEKEKAQSEKLIDLNTIALLTHPIKYYKFSELDQKPSIVSEIDNNPPELSKYSEGGEITVQVWINEKGYVVKAEIFKSELPEEFNESALRSFQNAKFLPGIKNDNPVNSVAKVVIQYRALNSTR